MDLYSALLVVAHTQGAQAWITQFYLQITPCLPLTVDISCIVSEIKHPLRKTAANIFALFLQPSQIPGLSGDIHLKVLISDYLHLTRY